MRHKVVLVDINFTILGTISWKKAIKLIFANKAQAIKNDETTVLYQNNSITIFLPKLIQLKTSVNYLWNAEINCTRKNIMIRDRFRCVYCDNSNKHNLTIDHIIPKSKGGKFTFENCVTCCSSCNKKKGNHTLEEVGFRLIRKPYYPSLSIFLNIKILDENLGDVLEDIGLWKTKTKLSSSLQKSKEDAKIYNE